MPDYASILKRSVSALPDSSPEMREAVYQRARAALARQLTAVDPPLSTREIETQHQELEDAVVRIEAEFAPQEEPTDGIETLSRDDFLYSAPAMRSPEPSVEAEPAAPFSEDEPTAPRYEDESEEFEEEEDEERSSRVLVLVGVLFAALIVIGAGAYLYAERATVLGFLTPSGEHASVAAVDTATSPEPAPAVPEKKPDRLVNGSEALPPEAPPPDVGANTAVVEPPPPAPAPAPVAALEPPAAEAPAVAPPATAAPLETGLGEDAAASQEPSGTSLVEQRAIYYYQGSEGEAGQASQGTTTWAEITKDDRPAIQATIHVPQPSVTVTVTIYKNYDATLPASHLVEVQFTGKLSESPIQRVPALVLKQTEQARGQPLAGAAVPVTNELFWIALSDDADEVVRNVQLLREGSWFDIPILFGDQTRALITFEKGVPGDKVFETVMASWTPS